MTWRSRRRRSVSEASASVPARPTDKRPSATQVDFLGDPVADLTAVSFHVFTTGENIAIHPANLPRIAIEIVANLTPGVGDFTTMVYQPPNTSIAGMARRSTRGDLAELVAHWCRRRRTTGCNQRDDVHACTT